MEVKIKKLSENATIPIRGSVKSAGYDLYVSTTEEKVIEPHTTRMFNTDLAIEFPEGYFGAVFPRSGISAKRGLRLANCVAVIDEDFRGNIGIPIHNDNDEPRTIDPKERVAQIVFLPYKDVEFVEVEELSNTERGNKGFGSTGV